MLNGIKKLPYGVSDFVSVREENLYYVDKTMYLPELEDQAHTLIYIRPRRFGKSLFISMMEAYYDKLDGDRKGLLQRIIDDGQILGTVAESFPAIEMVKPEMFVSLLFYYGMLTIQGIRGIQLVLGIPNNNVRVQYYNYLLENYRPLIDLSEFHLRELFMDMAIRGEWRPALAYMAEAYGNLSSVRDQIEGERNIQGFFMAYLSLNDYYLVAPELEMKHGYCDFFLLPNLTHYQAAHSYILELKYLAKGAPAEEADKQWDEAVEQVKGYAAAPRVEALRQGTRLHRIVVQFRGWKAERMEEV